MDATSQRAGLVGCISEFSLGNIASVDMWATATARNVAVCQN